MTHVPCIQCDKQMELCCPEQPHGGGEIILEFHFGSEKFDLHVFGTRFKAFICDDCAVPLTEKMEIEK